MRVLLTGATGFIGSQLALRLVVEGHEVAVVVRPDSRLDVLQAIIPRITVHIYDGSYESLVRALEVSRPELVIHVASLFLAQHKSSDVARLIESNLNFPAQLLEAMSQVGTGYMLNTGTSWQHYQNEIYNPVNLYAASKQAFEALLEYYVKAQGLKVITLKLFDTYGPGDFRPKLFSLLRRTARTGNILRMSPGEQEIDLVYIDDVLEAFLMAMQRLNIVTTAENYAVSNSMRLSLRELTHIYGEATGYMLNVEWGGLPYRPREVMTPWTGGQLLPGWKVRMPISEGIVRMESDASIGGILAESSS